MTPADILEIKQKAVPILKEAGATKSALFGSVVRNETRNDSDIDLLVELPRNKSLLDFIGIKIELEEALNKKVDLVEYAAIKPNLKSFILSNLIPII